MPGLELSRHQREAAFLKLYCEFSYEQVAAIMHLDAEMIYALVNQSFEILQRQYRKAKRCAAGV
jgi:DNA-directed RNA polymerase specialized sigma24 family protein